METTSNVKPYVVGMDIGGTNSVFGIVDQEGKVLCHDSIKTQPCKTPEAHVAQVCARLLPMIQSVGGIENIQGMGIGAPNGNFYTGAIEFAPNLPWKGFVPLAELYSKALDIPVALTNDANAAAIGEMKYGAAKGMKNFIMITLGTGVGGGVVVNGELVYGHDGLAGELGHVRVERGGRQCGCGKKGCLEAYCSATGVARTAKEIVSTTDQPTPLRQLNVDEITSKDVYDAAVAGDPVAKEIFETTGRILGETLADFMAFSSPEAFVIFGGLTKSGDLIMDPIRRHLEENVLPIYRGKAQVLISGLKDSDAAVLGASALGWDAK